MKSSFNGIDLVEVYKKHRHLMEKAPLKFMEQFAPAVERWNGRLPNGCFDQYLPEIMVFVRNNKELIDTFWAKYKRNNSYN